MMGLETLLEAARYLEYKAEMEARGEKVFPDLPINETSSHPVRTTSHNNRLVNHGVVPDPNGIHYLALAAAFKSHQMKASTSASLPREPEPVNDFKISANHSYRPINQGCIEGVAKGAIAPPEIPKDGNSGVRAVYRNFGTREVHRRSEKNRRAHLKECCELLKSEIPELNDRKISTLALLRSSRRHIRTLKSKQLEYEHEMERLAREKIALHQKLSALKLGKKDHNMVWQDISPEDLDVEMDERNNGAEIHSLSSEPLGNHRSSVSEPNSPFTATQPPKKNDVDLEESDDSQHPQSLTVNDCLTGDDYFSKKLFGQVNQVNEISSTGPISLVTASKFSSSPLPAIAAEKTANSPIGGASYENDTACKEIPTYNTKYTNQLNPFYSPNSYNN